MVIDLIYDLLLQIQKYTYKVDLKKNYKQKVYVRSRALPEGCKT